MSNCSVKPHNRPHSSAHQPLTQTRIPAGRRPGIVSYSITRSIRGTQIPIVRDEPPSSRFPRFPPLEVFRRRPPMRAAPSVSGRHPKTFTKAVVSRCSNVRARKAELFDHLVGNGEQPWRKTEAEYSGGVEVDHELEFGRLDDR